MQYTLLSRLTRCALMPACVCARVHYCMHCMRSHLRAQPTCCWASSPSATGRSPAPAGSSPGWPSSAVAPRGTSLYHGYVGVSEVHRKQAAMQHAGCLLPLLPTFNAHPCTMFIKLCCTIHHLCPMGPMATTPAVLLACEPPGPDVKHALVPRAEPLFAPAVKPSADDI